MEKQPLTLRTLGRSGSGKDTQADLLRKRFKIDLSISMGDLLREVASKETIVGRKIKYIHDSGGLPEPWIVCYLWQKELVEKLVRRDQSLLIDAARRIEEARILDEVLAWLGRSLFAILIDVPREVACERLMARKGKAYDNEEAINKRLDWYDSVVKETVEYYKAAGKLVTVDGIGSVEEVHERIVKALKGKGLV